MRDVSCNLIAYKFIQDEVGNELAMENVRENIPIIKVEDIYADEYYKASQQGSRPTLRLRMSSLNYEDEKELEYMNKRYTVIRTQDLVDEIILVCERKISNGTN